MDEEDEDLRVLDLGEAFPQGTEPRLAQPGNLERQKRFSQTKLIIESICGGQALW